MGWRGSCGRLFRCHFLRSSEECCGCRHFFGRIPFKRDSSFCAGEKINVRNRRVYKIRYREYFFSFLSGGERKKSGVSIESMQTGQTGTRPSGHDFMEICANTKANQPTCLPLGSLAGFNTSSESNFFAVTATSSRPFNCYGLCRTPLTASQLDQVLRR